MRTLLPLSLAIAALAPATARAQGQVDEFVRTFLQRRHIPGATIAVVQHGRIVKVSGYGIANLELSVPAGEKTVYEIGSISKQFAAEAIMLLVEDGRLRLDDAISAYLPDAPPAWSGITVRHLVTHTSGLHDWESAGDFSYRREYSPAEFVALVAKYPLDFAPGEQFAYTNSGAPLLGLIIEKVTGTPYEQFVRERILQRVGMSDTRFKHPEDVVPGRSGGYVDRDGSVVLGEPLRPRIIAPSGGVMSTGLDMAKWDVALWSGVVLKPGTVEQMYAPIHLNGGRPFNAGIGWFFDTFRGHLFVLHNGSTVTGFSSVVYHYPTDSLGVIVLMNIDRWNAVNVLATRVASFFVPGLAIGNLPERSDPDPQFSGKLVAMLADIADGHDTEMLAPNLRISSGAPRAQRSNGFKGPADRFAYLEREDLGERGEQRWGNLIRAIYRYKLVSGPRIIYYTFELTLDGKVARFVPEEE